MTPPDSGKKLILHVDDSEDILSITQLALNSIGMDFVSATTAQAGIDLAEKRTPDLILLDVQLPDMDGHRACFILKSNPKTKNIPIIMLTTKDAKTDVRKAVSFGASEYVTKPFKKEDLITRILEVLKLAGKQ